MLTQPYGGVSSCINATPAYSDGPRGARKAAIRMAMTSARRRAVQLVHGRCRHGAAAARTVAPRMGGRLEGAPRVFRTSGHLVRLGTRFSSAVCTGERFPTRT